MSATHSTFGDAGENLALHEIVSDHHAREHGSSCDPFLTLTSPERPAALISR